MSYICEVRRMRKLMMVLIALFIVLLVDQWTEEIDEPIYGTSSFKLPVSLERIDNPLDDAGNGSGIYSTLSQVQVVDVSIVEGRYLLLRGIVLCDLHEYYTSDTEQTFLIKSLPNFIREMVSALYTVDTCFIYALVNEGSADTVHDETGTPIELTNTAVCVASEAHIIPIINEAIDIDVWKSFCNGFTAYYTDPFESVSGMENIDALLLEHSDPDYSDQYYAECFASDDLEYENALLRYENAIKRRRNLSILYGSCIVVLTGIYFKRSDRKGDKKESYS